MIAKSPPRRGARRADGDEAIVFLREIVRSRELDALAGDAFELTPEASAAPAPRSADSSAPIQVGVGLLAELERRGRSDAPARWAALVRETPGEARVVAIQAAGAHPSEPVRIALADAAAGEDARAAAGALRRLDTPR